VSGGPRPREYALVASVATARSLAPDGRGDAYPAGAGAASAGVVFVLRLALCRVEYYFTRTRSAVRALSGRPRFQDIIDGLEAEARARLTEDGFTRRPDRDPAAPACDYRAICSELRVPLAAGRLDRAALTALEEGFGAEPRTTYGHRAGVEEPVETGRLEVNRPRHPDTPARGIGRGGEPGARYRDRQPATPRLISARGSTTSQGWLDVRVVNRSALATAHPGPCIVEEYGRDLSRPAGLECPPRRLRQHRDEPRLTLLSDRRPPAGMPAGRRRSGQPSLQTTRRPSAAVDNVA